MNFCVIGKKENPLIPLLKAVWISIAFSVVGCGHSAKILPRTSGSGVETNPVEKPKVTSLEGVSVWMDGGGVRGLFGAGVLKSFMQAGIKITSVYSNETGAISSAVVGFSKSYHLVEWNLKKLDLQEIYGESKGVFHGILKKKDPGAKLKENLERLFQGARIEEMNFPTRFWIDGFWVQEGVVADLVQRAVFDRNPFRSPDEWNSDAFKSVPVFISTGGGSATAQSNLKLITIKGDLQSVKEDDYTNINAVFFQGKKAGESYVSRIKALLKNTNED